MSKGASLKKEKKTARRCAACGEWETDNHDLKRVGDVLVCNNYTCTACPQCHGKLTAKEHKGKGWGRAPLCAKCHKALLKDIRSRTRETITLKGRKSDVSISRKRDSTNYFYAERLSAVTGLIEVVEFAFLKFADRTERIIQWKTIQAEHSLSEWQERGRHSTNPIPGGFQLKRITRSKGDAWDENHHEHRFRFWLRARGFRVLIYKHRGLRTRDPYGDDRLTVAEAKAKNWRNNIDAELGPDHEKKMERIDKKGLKGVEDLEAFLDNADYDPDFLGVGAIETAVSQAQQ